MHVHAKSPTLPQPVTPRPEKPTVARQDALSVPRVSDALSGGGGRRNSAPQRDPRGRSNPDRSDTQHDPSGSFAAKLVALSLAALDGEAVPIVSDYPAAVGSELDDLLAGAVPNRPNAD